MKRDVSDRPLRVLLFSPLVGRDPASGDTSYTETLLRYPPDGVTYVSYAEALVDGRLVELGRKPMRGRRFQPLLFLVRCLELALRRAGLMFREPVWWVSVKPGAFDLVHQHLFAVRQVGPTTPVVSSAGYPLSALYRTRDGWARWRVAIAQRLELSYARAADVHVPWLHRRRGPSLMTVYSEAFRDWLVERGEDAGRIRIVSTFLEDREVSSAPHRGLSLLFVGRDYLRKGGPAAVEAFGILRAEDPTCRMVVVTSAPNTRAVPDVPGLMVLADVDRDEVYRLLSASDVLVAPTTSDCGVPYAVLEALRAGVSVVTSTLPWLDDRLVGTGVRRVPGTGAAVAAAVTELADDLVKEAEGARELYLRFFRAPGCLESTLLPMYVELARPVQDTSSGVLVVAPRRDVRWAPFDGFTLRHRSIVRALAARGRVVLAVLDDDSPRDESWPAVAEVERWQAPARPASRRARLLSAARTAIGRDDDHADEWGRLVESSGCDRALTVGPWVQSDYRPVWRRLPTVHLFEEELTQVAELAPQSRQAKLLRRFEWRLEALSRAQPRRVVAISEPETTTAARRFPTVPVRCVPFGLDAADWPVFDSASDGDDVIVVGNFAEARNAEGLAEVLRLVSGGELRFRIVSGPGVHASLAPYVDAGTLTVERSPASLSQSYRRSWASLVPARIVTGQKTTILQAWACGVPVVASEETAATVNAPDALRAGATAADLVSLLSELRADPDERRRLAQAGFEVVAERHTEERQNEAVLRLIDDVAAFPERG